MTSPTVESSKGRLSQKLQSQSTFSCEIVRVYSLFRHGFIDKPESIQSAVSTVISRH